MKKLILLMPVALLLACQPQAADTAAESSAAAPVALSNDAAQFSYAAGHDIGTRLKDLGDVDIDLDAMMAGLDDGLNQKDPKMTAEEMNAVKNRVYKAATDKRNAERDAKAGEALEKGKAFLAENKSKDGVQVTDSGLQYIVEKEGEGVSPKPTDTVVVHYKGTLLDGTEFDSSYKRDQPAKFRLNGVIAGWTEGLQLMKAGGKNRFFIPAELAYGKRGAGALIGPNETLIFEVELLEVQVAE